MNAQELIVRLATSRLGAEVTPGRNGPYGDPETVARNASHWLVTFARVYEWTGDERFRAEVHRLADLLTSEACLPRGGNFLFRTGANKDRCNGLIGPAWALLGLEQAQLVLRDESIGRVRLEVALRHPFEAAFGLWRVLEVDGRVLGIDPTFNHQLWFCAAISGLVVTDPTIRSRVFMFLDELDKNAEIFRNGLVFHPIDRNLRDPRGGNRILALAKRLHLHPNQVRREWMGAAASMVTKSMGYHYFNLFAFEILRRNVSHAALWSPSVSSAFEFGRSRLTPDALSDNAFAFPYNAPGFEVPFAYERTDNIELARRWYRRQLRMTYDCESATFRNVADPTTLNARVFELAMASESTLRGLGGE